jgi:hypothetical protein
MLNTVYKLVGQLGVCFRLVSEVVSKMRLGTLILLQSLWVTCAELALEMAGAELLKFKLRWGYGRRTAFRYRREL